MTTYDPTQVSVDVLRALLASPRGRSALIRRHDGRLEIVGPDQAAEACLTGEAALLATKTDLEDSDIRLDPDGRFIRGALGRAREVVAEIQAAQDTP
jgi:hypothetical protein